ncbi:universal stress protein [Streptomyces sp. NPDC058326]|uniref:universal stress protein n=1 Tax=Streptomyces sp. NPDC058326 TaxID=3346447 RepID=UPI0036ECBAFC
MGAEQPIPRRLTAVPGWEVSPSGRAPERRANTGGGAMTSEIPTRPELGDIVVGVDGSLSARTAVLWAAAEADRRGRTLHIVHAADSDRRALFADAETLQAVRAAGRDLLNETASAVHYLFPDLAVTKELSRQEPVAGLRAAAGRRGTIVVGNRGLGGFSTLMLGSVGLGVAARAEVPVIVVRGDTDRSDTGSVTAAVRGASDTGWLLVAAAEADARTSVLRLVSVWNVLTHLGRVATTLDDPEGIARQRVNEIRALADRVLDFYPRLIVKHHVETGTSTPGLLVEASAHTDLLVMGREHRVLGAGPSLGRVAHVLLHHAHCPVEIVPPAYATRLEEN